MADIELIIKIPESRYRLLQRQAKTNLGRENLDEFAEAVLNGTPLPKGHGIPQQKMGCEGCIYDKTENNNSTYPCSHCGRCYTDKYKSESEKA